MTARPLVVLGVAIVSRLSAAQGVVEGSVTLQGAKVMGAVAYLLSERSPGGGEPGRALIDQRGLQFMPNAVVVYPGSEVAFLNSDSVRHSVFSPTRGGAGFDLGTYHSGERRVRLFDSAGVFVILCDVHPEMAAHVYVVASRWHAVTDSSGAFRITGIPAGAYLLEVRYRRRAAVRLPVRVGDNASTRADVTLIVGGPGRSTDSRP